MCIFKVFDGESVNILLETNTIMKMYFTFVLMNNFIVVIVLIDLFCEPLSL